MGIKSIISIRAYEKRLSFDLIYEWEDAISQYLHVPLNCISKFDKLIMALPLIGRLYLRSFSFVYHMAPSISRLKLWNKPNIIPCLVDFYLTSDEELAIFYSGYSNNEIVLISSCEVYEFLKKKNCPIHLAHMPLSISDKYRINKDTTYDKKFDLIMMGRQSPVLRSFTEKYASEHPDFYYVYKADGSNDYVSNKGDNFGDAKTREQYMKLMSQAKVGLYSTPGTDNDRNTSGFSQVTPRFLELIANGCHIISRYQENPDTEYYEMKKICPHTEDYNSFVVQMDYALNHPVDMLKYSNYLEKHYTSTRAKMLEEIVGTL